jgi:hypothetical protein
VLVIATSTGAVQAEEGANKKSVTGFDVVTT